MGSFCLGSLLNMHKFCFLRLDSVRFTCLDKLNLHFLFFAAILGMTYF